MHPQGTIALDGFVSDGKDAPQGAAAVMDQIRSGVISTVIFGGCDLAGIFRAKRVPSERFAASPQPAIDFSEYMWVLDIDDSPQPPPGDIQDWPDWPDWSTGFGDVVAVADLSTLRRVPWLERTAIVLSDYHNGDGSDCEISPRRVLRRVIERCERLGFEPRFAPEYEFIVLRETEESLTEKGFHDMKPLFSRPMAYGSMRATLDNRLIGGIVEGLRALRVTVEAWNPEGALGQYELNVPNAPALEAADIGFLLKQGVKEMCALEGMTATFMPKLTSADFGSSLHVHQSLRRDGEPVFYDGDHDDGMSSTFRHYVAGQLETLIPFTPIWLPNPPSFKRRADYTAAGTTQSWGGDNKTVSLRALAREPNTSRVEHRVAGSDVNIYLALAAMLAGGLHGIENELEPPPPTSGDAYGNPDLKRLPQTLEDSLDAFEQNSVANEYLGEDFVRRYTAVRRWEVEKARAEITDWELKRYLVRA